MKKPNKTGFYWFRYFEGDPWTIASVEREGRRLVMYIPGVAGQLRVSIHSGDFGEKVREHRKCGG